MNETYCAMVREMETHRVLFHLRIIYILLFIMSAFSIAAMWISLEAYAGFKRLDRLKWSRFYYPTRVNMSEDETQRAKRNHLEPPDMYQDVTFESLSSSSNIDLYSLTIDYNFCRRVMSDCDLRTPVYTGAKGQKGEPGIDGKGVKGCRGEKGDEGLPGIPGKEGDKGRKGMKGDAGLLGIPGIPGISGSKGDIGNPGAQGPRGYPGYQGEKGEKGEHGNQGVPGPTGRQGNEGPKGDIGDRGPRGGNGYPGVKGDRGAEGQRGSRGQLGPRGRKGETGQKGDRGNDGPKGIKGDPGSRGEPGAIGPKGEVGEKGSQGQSWSPSSNDTCLCSCTYLGAPTTSPVTVIQDKDMTTDIIACTATSTTTSTSTTTATPTTTTTPVPTTPKPRKSYCIIKKIGIPFFKMKSWSAKGSWMRDQFANSGKMWITDGINGQFLKEFASMENTESVISYNLTQFYYQGTDHIVYNGTFCYHWKDTIKIVCYDLRLRSVVMAIDVDDANHDDDRTLYKGSNSYFDLEADDNGLWLIYSKKTDWDHTYVSLFHPGTLREYRRIKVPVKAWEYGNGFISCGILYLVTSSSIQRTSITFAYDLFEMKSLPVSLSFINPYADSSMVSFYYNENPRFCRILGWDDGKLIDYQILFQ